jgi:hypothetical protein
MVDHLLARYLRDKCCFPSEGVCLVGCGEGVSVHPKPAMPALGAPRGRSGVSWAKHSDNLSLCFAVPATGPTPIHDGTTIKAGAVSVILFASIARHAAVPSYA